MHTQIVCIANNNNSAQLQQHPPYLSLLHPPFSLIRLINSCVIWILVLSTGRRYPYRTTRGSFLSVPPPLHRCFNKLFLSFSITARPFACVVYLPACCRPLQFWPTLIRIRTVATATGQAASQQQQQAHNTVHILLYIVCICLFECVVCPDDYKNVRSNTRPPHIQMIKLLLTEFLILLLCSIHGGFCDGTVLPLPPLPVCALRDFSMLPPAEPPLL